MTPQWPRATLFTVHVTQPPAKHLHLGKLHVAHEVCLAYVSVKAHANIEKKHFREITGIYLFNVYFWSCPKNWRHFLKKNEVNLGPVSMNITSIKTNFNINTNNFVSQVLCDAVAPFSSLKNLMINFFSKCRFQLSFTDNVLI